MKKKLNKISKEDFFYVLKDNYDEHIELAIPYYRQMHKEILRYVPKTKDTLRVLDLGCGTGKTAAQVLKHHDNATVRGIDLFEEMLNHARTRLESFNDRVEYVQADFRDLPFGKGYDLVISALAIHHSTIEEKQELFRRVHKALVPGGRFLMIDWTKFRDPFVQSLSAEIAESHARRKVKDEKTIQDWRQHWRERNIPDTIEDLTLWLGQAGFEYAECIVRYYGIAMFCAEKK